MHFWERNIRIVLKVLIWLHLWLFILTDFWTIFIKFIADVYILHLKRLSPIWIFRIPLNCWMVLSSIARFFNLELLTFINRLFDLLDVVGVSDEQLLVEDWRSNIITKSFDWWIWILIQLTENDLIEWWPLCSLILFTMFIVLTWDFVRNWRRQLAKWIFFQWWWHLQI